MPKKYILKDILEMSDEYFKQKDIKNPRLNAERLLSDYFKIQRLDLYLQFDKPISEKELSDIRVLLKRRGQNEPLQYIAGFTEFYGYNFKVTPDVLIPRHDTEVLVELVLLNCSTEEYRVLDIGTGSGCIPISLAKEYKGFNCIGMDISEDAINVAKTNAENNSVSDRVQFFKRDVMKNMSVKEKFDILISNPPYITTDEYKEIDDEVRDYEPRIALTDETSDGLTFYNRISEIIPDVLKENGLFFLEIGYMQGKKVFDIFSKISDNVEIHKDLAGNDRVVWGNYNKI